MERSTTCGCHFIDQPLSSFILRIDPPELPTHARWWIQQTVGGRDYFPRLWGCFTELVLFHRTSTEAYDLLAVVGRVGLFLCGRTPCAITTPDMSIWNVSRVPTLYQTSPFHACITAFCFSSFLGV